ncbi:hypothetical protein FRB90_009338 [Tulasnella sp. 427]|nr:hypothetical protein FRB90_009338 [Tulasnella sp. 427]
MRLRINEYSASHPLLLHAATFNVNGKLPSERLYPLLGFTSGKTVTEEPIPDIFVFGFQELDLSTEALLYLSTTEKEETWFDAIIEDLGDSSKDYVKLVSKQLVGMLIIVIVKKSLRPHIHHIHSTSSGQGYMWLGNKGGVAVRFRVYDTVFTFVNSHLAASRAAPGPLDDMVERRNADFTELRRVLKFPEPAAVPAGDAEYTASGVQHSGILESDYTFWIGGSYANLNYRIDLSDGDVRELINDSTQSRDYSTMLPFDQLKAQRALGKCFTEFSEGPITFIPTYRFELGPTLGQIHDVKRRPAWTDRILFHSAESVSLKQLNYDCHPNICLSDHKPVTARFEIEARTFNLEKMITTLEETRTPLEGPPELEDPPAMTVEANHVDLGKVSYVLNTIGRLIAFTQLLSSTLQMQYTREEDNKANEL